MRLVGQAVKTLASHAENMGSIPVRVTIKKAQALLVSACAFLFVLRTKPNPLALCIYVGLALFIERKGFAYRLWRYLALFVVSADE